MKRTAALLLAALALIAAGCGGDDDETTSSDDGNAEFVAEVTGVCDDIGGRLALAAQLLAADVAAGDNDALAETIENEIVPVFETLVDDLEAVTPPEDQADDYEALVGNIEETVNLLKDDPEAFIGAASGTGDASSDLAQEIEANEVESDELAASLGLPENCGEPEGGATGAPTTP